MHFNTDKEYITGENGFFLLYTTEMTTKQDGLG